MEERGDEENARYAGVYAHIGQLEAGHENRLAALYPMILSEDGTLANIAAQAVHTYMSRLDVSHIIKLDRQFRQYTSMEWSVDWKKIAPEDITERITGRDARQSVLRLGALHPNGYFREKCILALADDEDSLGYIALRLNDWVKQIRETAYGILAGRLADARTDAAIGMLPFISRAKCGMRYDDRQFGAIEKMLADKILLHPEEISLDKIRDYPPSTRRFLYKTLVVPVVLSRSDADRLLLREKTGNEKAQIIRLILKNYECSDGEIEEYLSNKSPIVRKNALALKYARVGGAWTGLENFLLDTARGIRSDVCYILRKHTDFDIISFYKRKLHTPGEAVAILGIGENGSEKDAAVLTEYLDSGKAGLVKNTLKAISGLGAKGADAVYWEKLNDQDSGIAKAAYAAICRSDIRYGAGMLYQAYQNCPNENTRKYILCLLVREPSWERLPYLLLLYQPTSGADDRTRRMVRGAIRFRSVYAGITGEQADFITKTMERPELGIPEEIKKEILFDLRHIAIRG